MQYLVVDVNAVRRLLQHNGIRLRRLQQHAPALLLLLESGVVGRSMVVLLPLQQHRLFRSVRNLLFPWDQNCYTLASRG